MTDPTPLTIPDYMPNLIHGAGRTPAEGGCAMQVVDYLDRGGWTDKPPCVHPVLRHAAITVNDKIADPAERTRWFGTVVHRLMGSQSQVDGWSEQAQHVLSVRLAVWSARQVAHLVPDKPRVLCDAAVNAAAAWCDNPGPDTADAARSIAITFQAAFIVAAGYFTADAYAADAYAAARAAKNTVIATRSAADAAGCAFCAANAVRSTAAYAAGPAAFLDGLLDEYERLTGHQPQPITGQEWRQVADYMRDARGVTA